MWKNKGWMNSLQQIQSLHPIPSRTIPCYLEKWWYVVEKQTHNFVQFWSLNPCISHDHIITACYTKHHRFTVTLWHSKLAGSIAGKLQIYRVYPYLPRLVSLPNTWMMTNKKQVECLKKLSCYTASKVPCEENRFTSLY